MGIRRVRLLREPVEVHGPLESIAYRRAKIEWLKAQIGTYDATFDSWTFGPEIECALPRGWSHSRLAAHIETATGLECRTESTHARRTWWKVMYDGSVYGNGCEVVAPKLSGKAGFDDLSKVVKVLMDLGARVNVRCGLHVHVGVEDEGVDFFKRLVRMYAEAEDVIDSWMAPSRRRENSGFARSLKNRVNWSKLEQR
jgi:hypothetical protein